MTNNPSKNHGFSLLEILISLVIMSVGMMGLAGLKIVAIKGTNEAHFRHEASLLMMDMADRMRGNLEAVDAGSYRSVAVVGTTAPTLCEGSTVCNSTQLASYDKYRIAKKLSMSMPGSAMTINCPSDCTTVANPSGFRQEHTINITWDVKKDKLENRDDSDHNVRTVSLTIRP